MTAYSISIYAPDEGTIWQSIGEFDTPDDAAYSAAEEAYSPDMGAEYDVWMRNEETGEVQKYAITVEFEPTFYWREA